MGSRPSDSTTELVTPSNTPHSDDEARVLQRQYRRAQEQTYATATVRRFARLVLIGWVGITPLAFGERNQLAVLGVHLAGLLYAGVITRALDAEQTALSEPRLRNLFIGLGTGLASVLSVEALLTGGLRSIYLYPQLLSLVGTAVVNIPWRKLAPRSLPVLAVPWLVTVGGVLASPSLRPRLSDPALLRHAAAILLTQIGAHTFFVFVADGHHRLRGQLYESRSLGRYKLRGRLGAGGMGEVWRAYDSAMKREVALKISRSTGQPISWARFEREVETLASLTHPNTVRVYDYALTPDGLRYYAMELLEGQTLANLVRSEGPMPWERAARLVAAAASALGEAHDRGVVHRDVKPQNIFVAKAGGERDFVKVIDFGVAQVQDPERAALTTTGVALGTPAYMSPEAILGKDVAPTADVYGLGATLHFALTGEPPYAAGSRSATLHAHLERPPGAPSAHESAVGVPEKLDEIVLRCLSKDPAARYRTGRELARALGELLDSVRAHDAPVLASTT